MTSPKASRHSSSPPTEVQHNHQTHSSHGSHGTHQTHAPQEPHQKKRIYPHIPRHRHSPLTLRHDPMDGFVNLAFLLLIAASLQLILKNYYQYGLVVDLTFIACIWGDLDGAAALSILMVVHSFSAWLIIKAQVQKILGNTGALGMYVVAQLILYIVPIRVVFARQMAPLMGGGVALILVILSMKMHSYWATNTILLKHQQKGRHRDDNFPANVTISDYGYFLVAPTLVYETHYPRTNSVNYLFAAKELAICFACLIGCHLVFSQFILPILGDEERLLHSGLWYDLLRLSIPSIVSWLLVFYAFFHCWLNVVAEITRFGDRGFYQDWWNSPSLDVFWRKWNSLVHEWLLRHVYLESIKTAKASPVAATLWTFLFSAVYHELIFFVAFRILRPWFFLAMFAQVPMIFISRWMLKLLESNPQGSFWGNINVWLGFFLGQPLIEILYIREWFYSNPSFFCVPKSVQLSWFF